MNESTLYKFLQRCETRPMERSLVINDEGIVMGVTLLAKFSGGRLLVDDAVVLALLSVASGSVLDVSVIHKIHAAGKAYRSGDTLTASMHIALTGIWGFTKIEQAQKLFAAEMYLASGGTPLGLLKNAGIETILACPVASRLYKFVGGDLGKAGFNPDEPGDDKGRWVDGGGNSYPNDIATESYPIETAIISLAGGTVGAAIRGTRAVADVESTIDSIIKETIPEPETPILTGGAKQLIKPGDIATANNDFDSLKLKDIKNKRNGIKVGILPNGNIVTVRPVSEPTIDIRNANTDKVIYKIRYRK